MATITLTQLCCIRKQDITGKDEPVLYIAGQEVWEGKMGKGDVTGKDGVKDLDESRDFTRAVHVELKEKNGNKYKSLGSWTIEDDPASDKKLTASSSGYHYEVVYDVVA